MILRKNRLPIVIFAFLFGLLAVRIALPNAVYRYEGSYAFTEGMASDGVAVYSGIALPPGVYRIELDFVSDTDLVGMCTVEDGTVILGGLLTNGEHLYAGDSPTGFHMWLYEGADDMKVIVSYGGRGVLQTGALTVRETDQLWLSLMVLLFTAAGVAAAVTYCRRRGVSPSRRHVIFCVTLIGLFAATPSLYGELVGGGRSDLSPSSDRGLQGRPFKRTVSGEAGAGVAVWAWVCKRCVLL